ncbi:SDR family NAD(P)-dependent oxidoreductase [Paracoccaceae bacterium GXU_MW_L88]
MSIQLNEKTVIVTGAAAGVGLATARIMAQRGARVMMTDDNDEKLKAECATLAEDGLTVAAYGGKLTEKLTRANLLSATIDQFERVDILINGSREAHSADPLEPEHDGFTTMMANNVEATLRLSQLVAKRMISQAEDLPEKPRSAGSIVNITSIAANRTLPVLMAYSVSCAAMEQLTRAMAVSLAEHRIRVNAVSLGSVMSAPLRAALKARKDLRKEMESVTPLGRIGEAKEAADAAVFLASNYASFITGQILAVDGGRSLLDPLDLPAVMDFEE